MAGGSARGVAGPVETLVHIPLTARPHKAWRAGAVETPRPGGAGPLVVARLRPTGVLFFGAVLSFVARGALADVAVGLLGHTGGAVPAGLGLAGVHVILA